jgi:hypothetical protein
LDLVGRGFMGIFRSLTAASDGRKAFLLSIFLLALTLLFLERALLPPPGMILAGHDMRGAYYLWHDTARQAIWQGELPLWDSRQVAGFPFLVNPQVGFFYPPGWLPLLLPTAVGISWYVAIHIWLAAVGMLLFVRTMSGRWLGALLAAVAFAFSGYLAGRLWAGHTVPLAVNAWLPWLLLGFTWSVRRGDWRAAVVGGVPFGLAILAGHVPSLLYLALVWGLFALYLMVAGEGVRPWLVIRQALIIGLTAFALSAVQLLPLLQFMVTSTRLSAPSFEFATDYSLPPTHLITLLIPEYFGEPTRVGYWSVPTFEELAYYAGILPLLALFLALRRPTRLTWFYLGLIVLGLWLALGKYSFLYRLFFDLLPPFRVVRAPARAAFLYTFAAAALLGEVLATWLRLPLVERRHYLRRLMPWLLSVVGIAAVAALAATGAVFATYHPTDTSGRLWHQIGGWSLFLALFLGSGGLLWAYLTIDPQRQPVRRLLAVALVVLVTADLWLFSFKMVRVESYAPQPLWQDARRLVGDSQDRVLPWGVSVFTQNEATAVGLNSVFAYDALEMAALEDFMASVPDPRATTYDILSAAYVIAPVRLDHFTGGEGGLTLMDHTDSVWVYRRSRPLPLARLVYQVEAIADRAAVIGRVHEPGFNPVTTAVLAAPPPCEIGPEPAAAATAVIKAARPGYWLIETNSDSPALLILSESAYPGWQVTVDGRPATPLTVYSVIKAVCVPAGQHQVEWRFVPLIFVAGGVITLFGLLFVALALTRVEAWNFMPGRWPARALIER